MSAPCVDSGDLAVSGARLRAEFVAAHRGGRDVVALRLAAVWWDIERGALLAADVLLSEVDVGLAGELVGVVRFLRGLLLHARGEDADAVRVLDSAVPLLDGSVWSAHARLARGLALLGSLRLAEAESELSAAEASFAAVGDVDRAALCVHHRGVVAYRHGDVGAALRLFESAGWRVVRFPEALVDRAEVLLAAGLSGDARRVLERAVRSLGRCGRSVRLADAALTAARCLLRVGDFRLAVSIADTAVRLFVAQHRSARAWAAAGVAMRARLAVGSGCARAALRLAGECRRRGLVEPAAELDCAVGGSALRSVVRQRFGRTARLRELGWLASARLAESGGDDRAAVRAASAGLGSSPGFADIGLGAVERIGCARGVLEWTDRLRSGVVAGDGFAVGEALNALRAGGDDSLVAENAVLRAVAASGEQGALSTLGTTKLVSALGLRTLVSFHRSGSLVRAVTVHDGSFGLRTVGEVGVLDGLVRALRFAHLLWLRRGSARAERAMRGAAAELGGLLFAGLSCDDGVVVVPNACLHGVPWSTVRPGVPISVTPSASAWLRARECAAGSGTFLAAGPELAHAERELAALDDGRATVLAGSRATVDSTLAGMRGVDIAHLVAHGRFRADRPLFSGVRMADGWLYGHDLRRLRNAPRVIVLSACESGMAASEEPERCLGLPTALLSAGAGTVIASVSPVPDDRAVDVMRTLHSLLRNGTPPATALADAQSRHGDLGFITIGA